MPDQDFSSGSLIALQTAASIAHERVESAMMTGRADLIAEAKAASEKAQLALGKAKRAALTPEERRLYDAQVAAWRADVHASRAAREDLIEILVAAFGPSPINTASAHGLDWHDIVEEITLHKHLLRARGAADVLEIDSVQQALDQARSAILHGVVGTSPEDVTGVSTDEALGYAADLIAVIDQAHKENR